MKIKIYAGITLLMLLVFSCSAVDKLLTFTISDEYSFTIPGGIPGGIPAGETFNVPTPDITSSSSTEFKNNKTNANLVKDVKLSELKLTITDPVNRTFSFLKSIHVYISTDGNDKVELAYLDDINSPTNTISLKTTDNNLDKYIKASTYKLHFVVVTKEALTTEIKVNSEMKFKVTASLF
jgi:hypothetical protein